MSRDLLYFFIAVGGALLLGLTRRAYRLSARARSYASGSTGSRTPTWTTCPTTVRAR
ncbi:MAG: hypothetical protein ABI874_06360 [Chloroflexota bacterium]